MKNIEKGFPIFISKIETKAKVKEKNPNTGRIHKELSEELRLINLEVKLDDGGLLDIPTKEKLAGIKVNGVWFIPVEGKTSNKYLDDIWDSL